MGVINYLKKTYYRSKVKSPSRILGLRPAKQIRQTCWLYSISNLIKHSKILKGNIAYTIHSINKLKTQMNNFVVKSKKNDPNFKNNKINIRTNFHACRMRNIYLKTLKNMSKEQINNRKLANFARKVQPIEEYRRLKIPRNNKKNNRKNILLRGGFAIPAFEKTLKLFGIIPASCIEYVPTPGYKLEGALINLKYTLNNNTSIIHVVTGVFDRLGRPFVIDSATGKSFNVDWRRSSFNKNFRTIYMGSKLTNNKNVNVLHVSKIYVKKLY